MSERILHQARKQQQELEDEEGVSNSAVRKITKLGEGDDDDEEDEGTPENEDFYDGGAPVSTIVWLVLKLI